MPKPIPTPGVGRVNCPVEVCNHGVNDHGPRKCTVPGCECRWSPNDIAHYLVFGNLHTPLAEAKSAVERILLAWD